MFFPILTVAAVLIGGWVFAAMSSARLREAKKLEHRSVFHNRQVSLWSLVFFLFFPSNLTLSSPSSLRLQELMSMRN